MRLALAFGEPHPDRLLECMTYRDLLEWGAYYSVEPWGEDRADMRSAMQAMVTANTTPFRGKNSKTFTMEDFILKFDAEPNKPAKQKRYPTAKQILEKAKVFTRRMGGKVPK